MNSRKADSTSEFPCCFLGDRPVTRKGKGNKMRRKSLSQNPYTPSFSTTPGLRAYQET